METARIRFCEKSNKIYFWMEIREHGENFWTGTREQSENYEGSMGTQNPLPWRPSFLCYLVATFSEPPSLVNELNYRLLSYLVVNFVETKKGQ